MAELVTRNVALEPTDDNIVAGVVKRYGLGERGYSAAMRIIIRQWAEINSVDADVLERVAAAVRKVGESAQ